LSFSKGTGLAVSSVIGDQYTCGNCKETFNRTRDDAEAKAEAEEKLGPTIDFDAPEGSDDAAVLVCDDCYLEIIL